ncbi:MAG: zinc metalloprotease, partial [Marmoricola sp.]
GEGASSARQTPKSRHYADTSPVTAEDLQALPPRETTRAYVNREVRPGLAARINLPVYAHIIHGRHKGERSVTRAKVRTLVATLNGGLAGNQSQYSPPLRYRFVLMRTDVTRNDGWYHAFLFGRRDVAAKRALHVGGPRTLNLYINGGGPKQNPILGWARFPWQYAATPKLDSVTVNKAGLRGGSASGYNLGDTVIHEVGHWLGLYHTFQGGCSTNNDLVTDTPAEAQPSFRCAYGRDTCPDDPGPDPIFNFMDYSYDYCMKRFTEGQVQRVDAAMAEWRL